MTRPWPASNVRIVRQYQAKCRICRWVSDVVAYPYRPVVERDKRLHVDEHRRGLHRGQS